MRWNSFTIIGILLIVVGLFGLAKGPTFQFDPGLPSPPFTWLYYVAVGILMIINGLIVPKSQIAAAKENASKSAEEKDAQAPVAASKTTTVSNS